MSRRVENPAKRRRNRRYELREVLRYHSKLKRIRECGRLPARSPEGDPRSPELRIHEGTAYYAGVGRCGSVWACPVCSAKIRHERAEEAEWAMNRWVQDGGSLLFLTLTIPHYRGESLEALMETIAVAVRRLFSGRPWRKDREDHRVQGWIRTWDTTHGANGWHPPLHMVLFTSNRLPAASLNALEDRLYERWARGIVERGHPQPSREHGIRLERAGTTDAPALAQYVMKVRGESGDDLVAMELMRGDLKQGRGGGRTPHRILGDFRATGDLADLALWHEWERVTKGRHFSQWSRGLKALTRVGERNDQEIVEEEVGGELIYRFPLPEWRAVCAREGFLAELLEVAEAEGNVGVRRSLYARLSSSSRIRGTIQAA